MITNFHANTPPRARQQSSDVPSARTHNTVGERVVTLVLCASSACTQTRSLSWCVHRIAHRDLNPDWNFRASSIARYSPSRGIIIVRHSLSCGILHRAAFSIARHSTSCGILHRAVFYIVRHSTLCGILHRAVYSITRHYPSANNKLFNTGITRRSRIQAHASC
jgi:hypothetical protein